MSFEDAAALQYGREIENVWNNQDPDAVYDIHHSNSQVTGMFDPIPYMDNVTINREEYKKLAELIHNATEDIEVESYEVNWEGTEDGGKGRTQADWEMVFHLPMDIELHAATRHTDDIKGGETFWYRENEDKLPKAIKTDLRWEIEEDLTDLFYHLM